MSEGDLQPGPYKRDLAERPSVRSGFFSEGLLTKTILLLNVCIFLLMIVTSSGQSLSHMQQRLMVDFGANFGPLTLSGQYWRVLTCTFLHFDVLHIFFNMYALWDVGRSVERLYGSSKFL